MTWPVLPSSCIVADVAGTPAVFDRRSGTLVVLDDVAAFVLRHGAAFASLDEASDALAETFGADRATVAADLRQLARRLGSLGHREERPTLGAGPRLHPPPATDVTTWRFDALGQAVEVSCQDRALSEVIGPLLEAHRHSPDPPIHRFDVWPDGAGVSVSMDGAQLHLQVSLVDAVAGLLTMITAVTMFGDRPSLLTHAAAVACGDDVIVMGGGSNQGKSTTTIELVQRGFGYLTDEIVALEPANGRVTGLARPIGLEGPMREHWPHLRPSWLDDDDPEPRWPVAPARIGGVVEEGALRLFVLLEAVDAGSTEVTPLGVLDALAALGGLAYNPDVVTERSLTQLGDVLLRTPAVRVRHRGAEAAADAVHDAYQRLVVRGMV